MSASHLHNVLIVGAGGNIGTHIVQQLLAEGKHTISALTRPDSTSMLPSGLHNVVKADYNNHAALTAAMRGQDVLIITMNSLQPASISMALVDAAAAAGVHYIIPNEWATDRKQVQLGKDLMLVESHIKVCDYIESKGLKWISVNCGFWYEYSLSCGEVTFGFDFAKKQLTLFDEGEVKISVSTWPQTGLAVARLLALPTKADDGLSLESLANRQVLVSSFSVSQRDMLKSVLRVTGGKESDWTIVREGSKERRARGLDMLQQGNRLGFILAMYARTFSPEDPMDHEARVTNQTLGLPKEDLDAATKVALGMVEK